MATSGSTDYQQVRNELVHDAFQLIGVYGVGRTISSEDMTFAVSQLNKMIKKWQTFGLSLWLKSEATLFLQKNQNHYKIGDNSSNTHCAPTEEVVYTALSAAATSGSSSIDLEDATGIVAGYNIGIVLSDNSIFWALVSSVVNNTITLDAALSDDAAQGALVSSYETNIGKPLRITSARRIYGRADTISAPRTAIAMPMLAYQDYMELPTKANTGLPNQIMYNPKRLYGDLYTWLAPSDANYRIEFTYERMLDDMDDIPNDFDFPSEWLEPLTWQLAVRLAPAWGRYDELQYLMPMASQMLEDLKDWDSEITYVEIQPDIRGDR